MTIDDAVKLLEATTKLVGAALWPAVAMFVVIRLGPELRALVARMAQGEVTLKGGGFEASIKLQKEQAAAALTEAIASRPEAGIPVKEARAVAADVVSDLVTPRRVRRAAGSTVLWVDDRPSNNVLERRALEAMKIDFVLATSTDEALATLERQPVDAIISDMGRPPDSRAGYTLLDKLRARGDSTPFIIYAGSRAPEHRAEARRHGAIGCTNQPDELFEMVVSTLDRTR